MELIPIEKIRVSELNIRAADGFGDEEDQALVENVGSYGILQPIIVRLVGDMYELIAGRRRLLSARENGLKEIPCIVKETSEEEALDISLIENIQRKDVDPVTLGRAIKRRMDSSGIRPSDYSRRIGIPKQTIDTWLRVLDLSPAMQSEVQCGTIPLRDALTVARMNLSPEVESTLAEVAKAEGTESFKKALDQVTVDRETRGAPKGLLIVRINWGFESPEYEALKRFAESEGLDLSEYCQKILADHIQARAQA